MEESQGALIGEQISHLVDLLRAENRMLTQRVAALEKDMRDHEQRLRTVNEGVVQFRMWLGLASAGNGALSLLALLQATLGGLL
jgi:hypothetical protein